LRRAGWQLGLLVLVVGLPVLAVMGVLPVAWPLVVAAIYGGMSLVTFIVYGYDKKVAQLNETLREPGRRVPEAWLHWLELAGGWPGAGLGQLLLRHKTRKAGYQAVFRLIVAAHIVGWGLYGAWVVWGRP
jgi:uncharacterized membrane protein YsdA (DUF1294 family)